jgi:hypothetical protein
MKLHIEKSRSVNKIAEALGLFFISGEGPFLNFIKGAISYTVGSYINLDLFPASSFLTDESPLDHHSSLERHYGGSLNQFFNFFHEKYQVGKKDSAIIAGLNYLKGIFSSDETTKPSNTFFLEKSLVWDTSLFSFVSHFVTTGILMYKLGTTNGLLVKGALFLYEIALDSYLAYNNKSLDKDTITLEGTRDELELLIHDMEGIFDNALSQEMLRVIH